MYLLTKSEVLMVKSQTKTLPYCSNAQQAIQGPGLGFSHKDWTVKVNKLFILWPYALVLQAHNAAHGHYGKIMPYN